jgi:hypothetical protein
MTPKVITTASHNLFKPGIKTSKRLLERLLLLSLQRGFGHNSERVLKDLEQRLPPALLYFKPQALHSHPEKSRWDSTCTRAHFTAVQ